MIKKRMIPILLMLLFASGCSSKEKSTETAEINVPTNNKAGTVETDEEQKKQAGNDTDAANDELSQADENGIITTIKGKDYVIDKTITEQIKGADGEDAEISYGSGEKLTFTVTKETEVKVVLYDSETMKSRMVKGSQADIQTDCSVSLYGQMSGEKFVSTKVIVLQVN